MEILLSGTQHDADQATASEPQREEAPARDQEIADLLEDSSRVLESLSRVVPSAAQEVSEPLASVNEPDPPVSPSPPEAIKQAELTTAMDSPPEPIAKNLDDHAESSPQREDSSSTTTDPTPRTSMSTPQTGAASSPTASPSESVASDHPAMTQSVSTRSQYAWLLELLRRRIISLQKTYPRSASMQGWEGVVVVKATIDQDGSLVDAVVTKSSGYGDIDEDALKLMHRVCPVRLPQDLGKPQIAVMIPIRYRFDQ
jgi:protein TonB